MLPTACYFPPNAAKVDGNLLTWDIAHEASQRCHEPIYFTSHTVASLLARFGVSNIALREIDLIGCLPADIRFQRLIKIVFE